jgi:hypothetical protein
MDKSGLAITLVTFNLVIQQAGHHGEFRASKHILSPGFAGVSTPASPFLLVDFMPSQKSRFELHTICDRGFTKL